MAKYLSGRNKNLKVGVVSYTENQTVLEVTGKVGIGTTNATSALDVIGDGRFTGVVTATTFIGNINAGVATITTLSGTNLNYGGIGTITNLSSTNGTITNLTGTAVTYTTLNATNGRFTGIATASQLYEDNYRVLTAQITEDTKDPIGTPDRAQSIIAFDNSTRTFSISPVSGSFEIWCVGTQHSYTTTQSIVLPNSSGSHYVYFNSVGILTSKQSSFTLSSDAPISYVYWNAGIGTSYLFADERHGVTMDWATHEYLHRTRGASLASGFSISNYSIAGIGSTNTDAQFDLEQGVFFDEDLEVQITHSNTPTVDTWEQDLQGPAKIPVFYLNGTEWVLDTSTDYALKQGTTRIRYNLLSGGVWSTPELTTDGYVASWILATNNLNYPVIAIIGQSFDVDSLPIENFNFQDLTLTSFPVVEFRPLYKIIWSSVSTYTNTPKATIHRIDDLRDVTTANPAAYVASNHGLLSGLSADDHLQYLHLDNARTVNAVHTFDVGLISNANILIGSNTSTGITSQRLQVTGGAYVSGNLGIGTNNPTVNLDIIGDGRFSGNVTATTFIGDISSNNAYITTGIVTTISGTTATYDTGNFTTLNLSGGYITTGIVTTISGTTATYDTGNFTTLNATTGYINTGIVTTISGINLNYSGIGTIGTLNVTNGTITSLTGTGVTYTNGTITTLSSTNGTITNLTGTAVTYTTANITNLTGTAGTITTLSSTNGTITNLTGTGVTYTTGNIITLNSTNGYINTGIITTLSGTNLNYSGIGTVGGVQISAGIITASGIGTVVYYGDGSHLQGVNAFNVINQDINSSPVYPTFASNIGVSSVGISTTKLVFIPVTGRLGIGTTNPTSTLDVAGDGRFIGVVTATTFIGNINAGIVTVSAISTGGTTGTNQYVLTSTGTGLIWQNVTGTGAITGVNISNDTENQVKYLLFGVGAGTTSTEYISTSQLTFNPSSGSLGIGTAIPTSKLDVVGDGKFSGTITASSFSGTVTGTATSTLHIPNLSGDISSVDTVTTLATVNSAIGTYGGTGSIPVVTVNAKGLVTGVTTVSPNDGTLTLAVSGTGLSGSGTFTANQAGSSSFTVTSNATSNNTNSTIVARDASGNFSAGIITATQLSTGASGIGINTDTISGPAIIIIDPAAVGDNTGAVRIKGDFYVDGTQTWINSTTLEIADYQIGIGTTAPSDLLLDGAGIGIGPVSSRKTFTWDNTNTALKSSENLNLASGKTYKINGTDVLSSNTLGSGIVASSLTSVGTLTILSVGNVYSTGIITATTFVGALTGTATSTTNIPNLTGDITSVNSVTSIAAGVIVNADINASAGIVDTKLATISTALKVSNSATTATNDNTASAIVARDASGNFSAGTITANLTGTASSTTNIPNLTGAITSNNTTTSLGSFTSAQLATALTDETGSGANVFATSPTLVTPVLGSASATNIIVSGISTFGNGSIGVKIDGTTGIITSSNPGIGTVVYYGDGSHLQGVNAFNVINQDINSSPVYPTFASNIGVSSVGISTTKLVFVPASGNLGLGTTNPTSTLDVVGDIKISGVSTLGTVKISAGIITASGIGTVVYYGDGSHLQGVNAFNVINQDINSSPVYPTFASNVGVSSVGISTTKLVFIPVTGRLGIGTTSPQYSLDSIGDINSSTAVRAKGIDILEEAMRLAIALG